MKKILVTGCAGFIGFSLSNFLKRYHVVGIDNMNTYYDINLKKDRLKILKKNKNFYFHRIDISNKTNSLFKILSSQKFDCIIHLAAQAGVRYSLIDPYSYINSNVLGTVNILEILKKIKFKGHLMVASTSSIYGKNDNIDFKENHKTDHQLSLYAASKKSVESIAHSYSHNFKINTTILRFFTVYGPWGRPDMALFKFVKSILNNEPLEVYNKGKMWRDFTYIDDLVFSIKSLIDKNPSIKSKITDDSLSPVAPYRIVNIGNQKAVKLIEFVKIIEKITNKKAIIKNLSMQKGDVNYTLSDSKLLNSLINFSPTTPVEIGVKNFYEWYLKYYHKKVFH